MTLANWEAAEDEICQHLTDAWSLAEPLLASINHEKKLRFASAKQNLPAGNSLWARVDLMLATERQASLSVAVGAMNQRRYEVAGVGQIEFNWPADKFAFREFAQKAGQSLKNALRGAKTPNGVWFEDVSLTANKAEKNSFYLVFNFKYHEVA